MAEKDGVNLKVFLRANNDTEIRRFMVSSDVVTNFLYIKEKLQTVFPILRGNDFKITWKDNDGDEITITSDEDLQTAFIEMSDNVKILYITVGPSKMDFSEFNAAEAQEASYHSAPRIICDVCNQLITGLRYKCLQCLDYDLCSSCEHEGHHTDHIMIRVPVSDIYVPKCARKFMHHVARNLKKSAHVASKEAHRAAKFATKLGAAAAKAATDENKTDDPQPSSSNESSQKQEKTGCPFTSEEMPFNVNDVHALGAMARQHLTPFLDVLQNTQPQPGPNEQGGMFFDLIRSAVDGFFGRDPQAPQQQQQQEQPDNSAASGDANKDTASATTPMDVESNVQGQESSTPASSADASTKPTENGNRRDPGWTFVATPPQTRVQTENNANSGGESQPTAPTFVYHENPRIAEGLVTLHEMGFSNEGGVLAHLLERYNGDVAMVVKALVDLRI